MKVNMFLFFVLTEKNKGLVTNHIFPEGNEPEGMESIILDGTLELTKSEIAGIAQIER